ncbi:hypothetical protein JVU11DRAFT_8820 [Chiua virens]|nr:hypothetical protein JVU11DRAFT_8820 [Chiua virens]
MLIVPCQNGQVDLTPDAAQSLQALAQGLFPLQTSSPTPLCLSRTRHRRPRPSSHPRGPPNLGQLSAAAAAVQTSPGPPIPEGDDLNTDPDDPDKPKTASGRTRGNRSAAMGTDEWARQRKDNHVRLLLSHHPSADPPTQKEVERRRRGNINEGINELGRIVPNSSGEKAKGAILARAVQYIHHLKENEARNIEKWTLEKLLMDQAMGDLQGQLEEMRRLWEEERAARQRAESELDVLRGVPQSGVPPSVGAPPRPPSQPRKSRSRSVEQQEGAPPNETRTELEGDGNAESGDGRPGKRLRVD